MYFGWISRISRKFLVFAVVYAVGFAVVFCVLFCFFLLLLSVSYLVKAVVFVFAVDVCVLFFVFFSYASQLFI